MSVQTRNVAVLLTDIKGFTEKTSHKSRSDIVAMLEKHKELVLPILESRGGSLIKTIGDAFLMVFNSPTDAVLAGVAVQEGLRTYNEGRTGDDRIDVRIAINAGEVTLADNDIFGEPVNITARIEGVAEAGEVYFTEAVYLAMNKSEVPSSEVGLLQLKGIAEKVRVYKVRRESPVGDAAAPAPSKSIPVGAGIPRGEKAAFVSAAAPSGSPSAAPTLKRRAVALALDAVICLFLLKPFAGEDEPRKVSVRYTPPPAAAEAKSPAKASGANVIDIKDGEDHVRIGASGIDIADGKDKVKIGLSGIHVEEDGKTVARVAPGEIKVETDEEEPRRGRKKGPGLFPFFWILYGAFFLWLWGTTPGGRIMSLKVVSCDGQPLSPKQIVSRPVVSFFSGSILFLGYLWAFWDKDKKGWHDKLAGTMVVDRAC